MIVIFAVSNVKALETWKCTTEYTQERGPTPAGMPSVSTSSRHRVTGPGMKGLASGENVIPIVVTFKECSILIDTV